MLKKGICLVFVVAVSAILLFRCTEQPPPQAAPDLAPTPAPNTPAPQTLAEKSWKAASMYVGREDSTSEDIVHSIVETIAYFRNQGHMTDKFSETALEAYANGASMKEAIITVFPDMEEGFEFYTGPFALEEITLTN